MRLEDRVGEVLDRLGVEYQREKTFSNLKYRSFLRFDYYLPEYKLCIETDEPQHFSYRDDRYSKSLAKHIEAKHRDLIKDSWCMIQGYHLLRISFLEEDLVEEWIKFALRKVCNSSQPLLIVSNPELYIKKLERSPHFDDVDIQVCAPPSESRSCNHILIPIISLSALLPLVYWLL
jgi:very-short-patch-repair endonuclease